MIWQQYLLHNWYRCSYYLKICSRHYCLSNITSPAHATQARNNLPQQPATHTPLNTLCNFPQLPTPPTFGNKDDDGGANLTTPGATGTSINIAVLPSPLPNWQWRPEKRRRVYRRLPERRPRHRGGRDGSAGAMVPSQNGGVACGSGTCRVRPGGR